MTKRTQELKDQLLNTTPQICLERAVIFTDSMKKTVGQPIVLRRAKAFSSVLSGINLYIRDKELIVGGAAGKLRAVSVFPEYSVEWIIEELNGKPYCFNKRPNDIFEYTPETKEQLLDILTYWRNKNMHKCLMDVMPEDLKDAIDIGAVIEDCTGCGYGNTLPNYDQLLKEGLRGVINRAKEKLSLLEPYKPGNAKKRFFLQSVIMTNEGVIRYANRYAKKLEESAKKEQDPVRKRELETMSSNCRRIPEYPARTFWEAIQAIWFIHVCLHFESNGNAISFGRVDQFLRPYYETDIAKGNITREKALELIESFIVKISEVNILRSWEGAKYFPDYHMAINVTVGGQTKDGKDAVNDLSYILLDATENMRLSKPSVSVRLFEGTSNDFLNRCLQVVQNHKGGQPAFYNDEGVKRMLRNMDVSEDDIWNWAPVGCIESSIPGKWDFAVKGQKLNTAKVFEITINNGTDPNTGKTLLKGDGDLSTFNNIQEVYQSFKKQLHFYIEKQVAIEFINDEMHMLHDINAFRASLIEDCIERGKALIDGGSVYSSDGGPSAGAITVSDGMAAIDTIVYDKKWITREQLKYAVETNFESESTVPSGKEIFELLNEKAPKFGNDDDRADSWATSVMDYIGSTYFWDFKNSRYGKGPVPCRYGLCQSALSANVAFGKNILALPNGKKSGEPVNNGISPSTGVEKSGLTATINSISKLPSIWFSRGAIFNIRLDPEQLDTLDGRKRVIGIIRTLFGNEQYHVQFNVFDTKELKNAQKNPENYKDLMVRVAGYSAFFTPLNKDLQEDIIKRSILE